MHEKDECEREFEKEGCEIECKNEECERECEKDKCEREFEKDEQYSVRHGNSKDPPSSLQISSKIRYQETKPNGRLRRSTGIAIHCEYQPNQISEPWNQGPI